MDTDSRFTFDRYTISEDRTTLTFGYTIIKDETTIPLAETLRLPIPIATPDLPQITALLESLHIGLGISYYKVFLPPVIVHPYDLTEAQVDFWDTVYREGLGEFLYTNQIGIERLATFGQPDVSSADAADVPPITLPVDETEQDAPKTELEEAWEEAAILAIGGGKDSIVGGELLKAIGLPLTGYVLGTGETYGQAQKVASEMGLDLLGVERTLDPRLLELNKRDDALNGHVPISMVFAFAGLLLCALMRKKYLVVNNEAAASLPNTAWQGMEINHQWSKSLVFEKLLQAYIAQNVSPDLYYFSVIRPLSSVAVCKLSVGYKTYLETFTSCNLVFRIDPAKRPKGRWCGECPKCLSSFILFMPWLDEPDMLRIFGSNFMDDSERLELFMELTGLEGHRPLDCVGTVDEMILSLNLAYQRGIFKDSKLMKVAVERNLIANDESWQAKRDVYLTPSTEHLIPAALSKPLIEAMNERLKP